MSAADRILWELMAPKLRGVHYAPDSARALLAEYRGEVAGPLEARIAELEAANGLLAATVLDSAQPVPCAARSKAGLPCQRDGGHPGDEHQHQADDGAALTSWTGWSE